MSAMKQASTQMLFQVNHVEGQTYWRKMGEQVLAFKITGYQPREVADPSIPGRRVDVSELTLTSGDRKVVLVKGQKQQQWEKSAILEFVPDGTKVTVVEGKDFEIKGQKYSVKSIDAQRSSVLISDSILGREITLGTLGTGDSGTLPVGQGLKGSPQGVQ